MDLRISIVLPSDVQANVACMTFVQNKRMGSAFPALAPGVNFTILVLSMI